MKKKEKENPPSDASRLLFRGWDGKAKRMIYNLALPAKDGIEVNQCIGLVDARGTPIYENDIVKWGHIVKYENPPRIALVKIDPDIVFETYTTTEFGCPHEFHYGGFAYKDTAVYLEVIGNIYENKDSLHGYSMLKEVESNGVFGKWDLRDIYLTGVCESMRRKMLDLPKDRIKDKWDYNRKSRYIESLLLGVPTPPLAFMKLDDEHYCYVIDGAERIKAICEYMADGFNLRGVQMAPSLNLKSYSKLPSSLKEKLQKCFVRYYLYEGITKVQAKDIRAMLNLHGAEESPHPEGRKAFAGRG